MSLNLSSAQSVMAALLMPYTLRVLLPDAVLTTTERCGFTPRGGAIQRSVDGRDQEQGTYRLTLPATSALDLSLDCEFTVDEFSLRRFVVVWAPPPSNLNLTRQYGVNEVR